MDPDTGTGVEWRDPYALMQSEEDRKQVDAVLSRIEHGVY